MRNKLGVEPNIKLLWHGTSTNHPKEIYRGEVGFDVRFSRAGLWGNAIYFARNAAYSNRYCYEYNALGVNTPKKQIFLA